MTLGLKNKVTYLLFCQRVRRCWSVGGGRVDGGGRRCGVKWKSVCEDTASSNDVILLSFSVIIKEATNLKISIISKLTWLYFNGILRYDPGYIFM